jgi:triphosphoribosyl-dephospho-CoA synthase
MNIALACLWESTARKVGNVHPSASFADMEYFDFVKSALALQEAWREPAANLGERIAQGVAASRAAVGKNTNLGIVLLLAPLLDHPNMTLKTVLSKTTVEDARELYRAIRLAAPGGLGEAKEQDVRTEPSCTLVEAMALAADRDMIAKQYSTNFADVLSFGVPAFCAVVAEFGCIEAAVIDCQLQWLAKFPDSLIARKNGSDVALGVQQRAVEVLRLGGLKTAEGRAAGVALDRELRKLGHLLNPGTTADLVTTCLFVALQENKVNPKLPFRWNVPDWL